MASLKRKSNDDNIVPALTASSLYDDAFPTDLLVRIGSYWSGKELSSYLLAASASKKIRGVHNDGQGSHHLVTTAKEIMQSIGQRCGVFLNLIGAPESMKDLLKSRMDHALGTLSNYSSPNPNGYIYMQSVSEWCAFLDYCESTPLRLSESRLEQSKPIQPLWIVGAGEFGLQHCGEGGPSPSIISVPSETWRPELIFLGEKWMVDFPQSHPSLNVGFMMDFSDIVGNMERTTAVLSWKDSRYLAYIHRAHDIAAGMMVYHEYPDTGDDNYCHLNWLSKQFCESMMAAHHGTRRTLEASKIGWMAEGTKLDNNMLASIEINDSCIPSDHMDKFGERVVKLMTEVEKWYADDFDDRVVVTRYAC